MVEIKFYILVAIIMWMGIWKRHKYFVINAWLIVSWLNLFLIHNHTIEILLDTKYAGHFALGILVFLLYKNERNKWMISAGMLSIWLVFENMIGYTNWIRSIYELPYTDLEILFFMLLIIGLLIVSVGTYGDSRMASVITALGAWSYPIYLIHADLGYFIRTQYYMRIINYTGPILNEYAIMLTAVLCSLIVAFGILKISEKL